MRNLLKLAKYHWRIEVEDTPLVLSLDFPPVHAIQIVRRIRPACERATAARGIDVTDNNAWWRRNRDVATSSCSTSRYRHDIRGLRVRWASHCGRSGRDLVGDADTYADGCRGYRLGCGGLIDHRDRRRDTVGGHLSYAVGNVRADSCTDAVDCRRDVRDACSRSCPMPGA